jgi:hypothetical protein
MPRVRPCCREAPTDLELRAEAAGKRELKELKKTGAPLPTGNAFAPKRNVRKQKARKR